MRWKSAVRTFFILAALALLPASGAVASVQVDINLFYDDLAPHGRWVETADYGWVFTPAVAHGWRPYTSGHWVWTDEYGWLWVSDEAFGWATYHYGRWYEDPSYGWAWVPGYEWAPAWVSFRSGGGYMGWAPLTPRYAWGGGGFRVGSVQFDAYIPPRDYIFVPERSFLDRSVRRHLVPVDRNPRIIEVTSNTTRYAVVNDRIVNRSFDVEQVERRVGRRVPRMRAVQAQSVRDARRVREQGNQVRIFNPVVRQAAVDRTPPRGKALPGHERRELRQETAARRGQEAVRERQAREQTAARERQVREQGAARARQDAARERRDAERRETVRRQQDDAQRKQAARERQVEERRQAQQANEERRNRQQLERRQAQERNQLERAHRNEIRRPPAGANTRELEQRREAQHRAMDQRQRQQQQDLQASREQARQAKQRQGERPRAENLWQREREQGANRPQRQPQPQKQNQPQRQNQQQRKKDQPQQEKSKGRH